MTTHRYELLADLLEYPAGEFHARATRARRAADLGIAGSALERFESFAAGITVEDAEELYTRTFDIQSQVCLEAGWHLFGDSYKRGSLLVKLRVALRDHGLDAGTELPDHMTVLLRLLAVLGDGEDPRSLAAEIMVPAIDTILPALEGSPYKDVLTAISSVLRADFAIAEGPPAPITENRTHLPVVYTEAEL